MDLQEVKRNLNKRVSYKGKKGIYELRACIIRRNKEGYYYQAELFDRVNGNSIVLCKLEDIETE